MRDDDFERLRRYYGELDYMIESYISCYDDRGMVAVARNAIIPPLLKLGKPTFVGEEECPTACVEVVNGTLTYKFNRDFYDQCYDEYKHRWNSSAYYDKPLTSSAVFVAMHEALHFILGHIKRGEGKDPLIWNFATDIVINEMLLRSLKRVSGLPQWTTVPFNILLARDFNIKNVKDKSAEQVYDEIKKYFVHLEIILPDSYEEEMHSAQQKSAITGIHDWDEECARGEAQCAVYAAELGMDNEELGRFWGSVAGAEGVYVSISRDEEMHCDDILRQNLASKIEYVIRTHEVWAPPARRMYNIYPDALLPNPLMRETEKKTLRLLLAIDVSGSITNDELSKFVGAVASLPDEYVLPTVITFDTQVETIPYEDFLNESIYIHGRGGTSFIAVKRWIDEEEKNSPRFDQVVVLTDGYAEAPDLSENEKSRWTWVVTYYGTTDYIHDAGTIIKIDG